MFNVCNKCGKQLVGLSWDYGNTWDCSSCYPDKTSVLHCEKGCKVKTTKLDSGYNSDAKQAHQYLRENEIYTVLQVNVGRSSSDIYLMEFPKISFNTVHFRRVQ